MRILLVYCHPCTESFGAALRDTASAALTLAGHEVDLIDLYAEGFDPVMGASERRGYHTPGDIEVPVADHLARLRQAEGLIFIYPTWWYGPPAMLKGWLDRVWVPHATFGMPEKGQP
ncbi:MAG: NAD(P)H-dependent oxidoreductase, partial [Bosea sp. (in: a-proteobacteria)]